MSDYAISYANLSAIENSLSNINKNIRTLNGNLEVIDNSVGVVNNNVKVVYDEVGALAQEFRNFVGTPYYLMLLINCIKDGQSKIPETAEELMEISIRAIIEREKEKGQPVANYPYLMIYLIEFYSAMDVSIDPHGLPIIKIIDIFAKVTKDKTLSPEIYAADKLLALFEELKLLKNTNDVICFENELIENFVLGKALEEPGSGIEELDFSGLFD